LEIEITSRGDEVPEKAKDYARSKVEKVRRIFDRVRRVHVSLEQGRLDGKPASTAQVVAHLDSGSTLVAETSHEDLRAAIDLVSDKIERQVRKEKERLIGRNRKILPGKPAPSPAPEEEPTYEEAIDEDLESD